MTCRYQVISWRRPTEVIAANAPETFRCEYPAIVVRQPIQKDLRPMYAVLKDFAGPLATFSAAVVAIVVTVVFTKAQLRIAESQRDIAHDKLKYDLFKYRYEIYEAAKALIKYV